jgi:hypothetical protein
MSLTSELKNPDSKISKLINSIIPESQAEKFITDYNKILSNASIIYPPSDSDLLTVGGAMSHAFYRQVTGNWGFDKPTMAIGGMDRTMSTSERFSFFAIAETAKTQVQKALIALVMAYYDGVGRGRPDSELKKVLEANVFSRKTLPTSMPELEQNHPLLNTIWDIANLIESFHLGWVDGLKSDDIHVNATFSGSHIVGGADAQMISNGMLIDIKTSRLKAPFTKKDLYQQFAYWLLDYDNQWNINEVVWIYPRHQMFLRYEMPQITALPKRSKQLLINKINDRKLLAR